MPKSKLKCSTGWKSIDFDQSGGEVLGCKRGDTQISVSEKFKEKRSITTGFARKVWEVRRVEDFETTGRTERPSRISAIREAVTQMERLNRIEARE